MKFIPRIEMPHPGELLYSWSCRIGGECGMSPSEFSNIYLRGEKEPQQKMHVDLGYDFVRFYKTACLNVGMLTLYQSTSTFQFESISMTEARQMKYVNSIFYPPSVFNENLQSIYEPAKICPECAKEDAERYGHVYLHREHNLSGVCACQKHGCKLLQYKGRKGHECDYDPDDYEEMDISLPLEDALSYASYSKGLLSAGIDSDAYHVKNAVMDKIKGGQRLTGDSYDEFMSEARKWEHAALFDDLDLEHRLRTTLTNASNMSMREVVPFLMYLYPDVSELAEAIQKEEPVLQEYTCPDCGRTYCSTPRAQREGWGCPYCLEREPAGERFTKLVEAAGNGEYTALDPFESMHTKIRFRHEICGKTFSMTPAKFLINGARCSCGRQVLRHDAEEFAEAHGFKLKRFTKTSERAVFYHEECGHEFECVYSTFAANPACRVCGSGSWRTPESFRYRVEQLVGDEYTVLTDFVDKDTKISIRHNVCGHIHDYRPDSFLNGQRCPDCQESVSRQELDAMLDAYSNGRYVIKKQTKSSCAVQDTETGRDSIMLTTRMLQEMRRPTPSDVLPVDGTEQRPAPPSEWDRMYSLLTQYSKETGTTRIPEREDYQGAHLGDWCRIQRMYHKQGTLSYGRTKKLEDIGFEWDLSKEALWEEKYELLKKYAERFGSSNVPKTKDYEGIHLGQWCKKQRVQYRKGMLNQDRIQKLEEIGFKWNVQ